MSNSLIGRKRDPKAVAQGALKRRLSSEKEKLIIELYMSDIPISKIGEIHNIHSSAIYRVIDRNNIPKRGVSTHFTGKTHTPETLEKISKGQQERWDKKKAEEKSKEEAEIEASKIQEIYRE